jgi:hypothetical protein
VPLLWSVVKLRRFLSGCQIVEFGSWYSIAKPTKSSGGVPFLQFIASSAMRSPRRTFSVNAAASLPPSTSNLSGIACSSQSLTASGLPCDGSIRRPRERVKRR